MFYNNNYSDDRLISQTWGSKSIVFQYDDTGSPYGFVYDNGTTKTMYYYIKNLQGDVMYIVNQTMAVVAKYAYDAYGNILYIRNGNEADVSGNPNHLGNINPIRYRGYYYDNETGFYYLQSRYYDPVVGRFLNADAYVSTGTGFDGFNMDVYCGNNPVNRMDNGGDYWKELKEVGKAFCQAGIIIAGVAAGVGLIAAALGGTVASGGAGAIALPIAVAAAEAVVTGSVAVAAAGATAVVVGEIGEKVTSGGKKPLIPVKTSDTVIMVARRRK